MNVRNLIPVLLLFIAHNATAQKAVEVERSWFAFSQAIDVTQYRGMPFMLESRIRMEHTVDTGAQARMWARVDTKKGSGFFDNMYNRPVTTSEWTTGTISGTIDTNAVELVIGGLVYFNGSFYYDDFSLKVQTGNGWKNVPVKNSGFENKKDTSWRLGIGKTIVKVKGYELGFLKEPGSKNTVLKVTGANIPAYGMDKTKGHYFTTNGVTLYYEIYGKGAPLLLLHGNGQSISAFNNQIPFFDKEYQVIVPDCRGRGRSTINDEELTYQVQASDMNNLLDHLHIDSANIIGWSDGGIIGLIMAKDYPGKVKKLIASGANTLQDTTAFLAGDSVKFQKVANDTAQPLIRRRLFNLMLKYPNIQPAELQKISCPVLIVAGDKDEIRIGHTVKLFESIPKGQLFIVPHSTHYLLSQNPKVFNEAALRFLKE